MRHTLSNWCHALGHRIDPAEQPGCTCRIAAFMEGWRAKRDAELRGIGLAHSPDEMDLWIRRVIAESEAGSYLD